MVVNKRNIIRLPIDNSKTRL